MPARPQRKKWVINLPRRKLTLQEHRKAIKEIGEKSGEYAGLPMALEGSQLVVHPSYRFAKAVNKKPEKQAPGDWELVNRWPSFDNPYTVSIWVNKKTGKRVAYKDMPPSRSAFQLNTMGMSAAWDIQAEEKALEKLKELVPQHIFDMYKLTGAFLQTSKRSGLIYMFRRLRPTVVITPHSGQECKVLCALCLHPIGYYAGTWAGAMVPTDEVVAHLLLMRGDEADFWRQANQHHGFRFESGL